jgi:ABC-2 type transport system permease protein
VLGWATRAGLADHAVMFTWWTWLFGWFVRILAQVLFFTTIGRLLGPGQARYLLIGNAVLMVTMHGMNTTASTTWELQNGTLGLLVASPSSPALVLAGRSLYWIPEGLACGFGALVILAPVANVGLTVTSVAMTAALMVLIGLSSFCLGLFLGAVIIVVPDLRNVVMNVTISAMMALCGPEFPPSALGPAAARAGEFLPLTHGLHAIREILAGGRGAPIVRLAALEFVVGAGWLVLAVAVIRLRARRSRRAGAALFLN